MYGHFGISKTFSFIIYIHLANIIVQYLMNNKSDPSILNVPKIIYWSLNGHILQIN